MTEFVVENGTVSITWPLTSTYYRNLRSYFIFI